MSSLHIHRQEEESADSRARGLVLPELAQAQEDLRLKVTPENIVALPAEITEGYEHTTVSRQIDEHEQPIIDTATGVEQEVAGEEPEYWTEIVPGFFKKSVRKVRSKIAFLLARNLTQEEVKRQQAHKRFLNKQQQTDVSQQQKIQHLSEVRQAQQLQQQLHVITEHAATTVQLQQQTSRAQTTQQHATLSAANAAKQTALRQPAAHTTSATRNSVTPAVEAHTASRAAQQSQQQLTAKEAEITRSTSPQQSLERASSLGIGVGPIAIMVNPLTLAITHSTLHLPVVDILSPVKFMETLITQAAHYQPSKNDPLVQQGTVITVQHHETHDHHHHSPNEKSHKDICTGEHCCGKTTVTTGSAEYITTKNDNVHLACQRPCCNPTPSPSHTYAQQPPHLAAQRAASGVAI